MMSRMQNESRKCGIRCDSGKCPDGLGCAASVEGVMKKSLVVAACLIIVISSVLTAAGQEPAGSSSGRTAAAPDRLFSQVVLCLQDGRFVTGLLLGFEDDAIVLRVGEGEVKTRRTDLAQITIDREQKSGGYALNGIVLGLLGGNLLLQHSAGSPTGFITYYSATNAIFSNSLYAGLGGTLGYLISLVAEPKNTMFDFSGRDAHRSAAWDKLRAFALASEMPGSGLWRLTVHSAYVMAGVSKRYADLFGAAGYQVVSEYSGGPRNANFNVIHRIGLSRAVGPRFEIGASVSLLGEKDAYAWKYDSSNFSSWDITQTLSGTAYYLTGSWLAVGSNNANGARLKFGLGLGAASVNFALNAISETYVNHSYSSTVASPSVSKTLVSALILTELDFPLYRGLYIGIMADYAFMPSISIPGIPGAGIPAQKLALGNGSLGIGFAWIF